MFQKKYGREKGEVVNRKRKNISRGGGEEDDFQFLLPPAKME